MQKTLDLNKKGAVGEYLKENVGKESTICFSSSLFTIYAFDEVNEIFQKASKVNFLFNEPTFIKKIQADEKEVKEFAIQMKKREKSISDYKLELALKNNLDQNYVALNCYNIVKNKVEMKSVIKNNSFTPTNILVKNKQAESFFINGSNLSFTLEGLGYTDKQRFDFSTVTEDKIMVSQYEQFYNSVWNNDDLVVDVKDTFLEYLTNLYKENSPELLYYFTLYKLFNQKLLAEDEMHKINERTGITTSKVWNMLYNFQQDAVIGAIKKLQKYNGCIIADSVGLGKTFEALAIIKYYELMNCRVLVLTPKKLRSNWTGFKQNSKSNFLAEDRFSYDVINHTDLSRDYGYSGDINLANINWGNYNLVVIDESHNFRNNPATTDRKTRYQKLMDDIIKSGIKTKVLMLSATPVNNRLADLKNQVMFITEGQDDALLNTDGISSIEKTLRIAQMRFNEWSKLPREEQLRDVLIPMLDQDFFDLLSAVTIARSRKQIQTYYDTKAIGDFPKRLKPISIQTDIDTNKKFPDLKSVNGMISKLHLPIYSPILYVLPNKFAEYEEMYQQTVKDGSSKFVQSDRERNLVNLMRINIFKRLESSIHSFKVTIERVLGQINNHLILIDKNKDLTLEYDEEDIDEEDMEDAEIGNKIKVKFRDLDIIRYKSDLLEDKHKLEQILTASMEVEPKFDSKLQRLKEQIKEKINNPINGLNKKIIIFSAFSDTATYLYDNLNQWLMDEHNLYSGIVTGSSFTKTNMPEVKNNFEDILVNFSPISNRIEISKNQIDILFATDCISEGQNLQDCDYMINYDIHWNPVRIVQRFGRIDRIGSKNKVIQLVNFWPNLELDEYINLEARVRNKMVMLDLSATGEDDIINAPSMKELYYRKEQLKQLKEEVLELEDISGGISITDLTFDEYVMTLERYQKNNPNKLEEYPTGIYAVTDINDQLTNIASKGVIYCLKQASPGLNIDKYYLVYVNDKAEVFISNTNAKKILDIYKGLCYGRDYLLKDLIKEFNTETINGTKMDKYTDCLESAVSDIKGVIEEKGIKSLFKFGAETIIENKISGLKDFQLISFLVVK